MLAGARRARVTSHGGDGASCEATASDRLGPAAAPTASPSCARWANAAWAWFTRRTIGNRIALKTQAHGEARFLAHLERELRLVPSVLHPNLVLLHGLFQGAGMWIFTI